jgi:hypothetical protein
MILTELDEMMDRMLEERWRQEDEAIEEFKSWAAYGHDYP